MSQKKKTTAQSKRPRKAPSNQTGGTAWGKKVAAAISGKMQSADMKKLILLNFPYIIAFYMVEKAAWLYRHCNGDTIVDRLMVLFMNFGLAYKSYLPSVHPFDLLVGLIGAAALKAVIYFKGKNAKKYRQGEEYGSARWGNAKDIEPFIDPVFENNVLLTQTERLMMSGRPKHPKYARNKNVIVIGGSGSGKTRFFVKPNLMQMSEKVSYPPLMEKPMNQKPSLHQMEYYQKFYENGEYVRAVESTTEQNYNMIDGCANNLPKPRIINGRESVLDKLRIRQMAREKQKSSQEQSADMERNRK